MPCRSTNSQGNSNCNLLRENGVWDIWVSLGSCNYIYTMLLLWAEPPDNTASPGYKFFNCIHDQKWELNYISVRLLKDVTGKLPHITHFLLRNWIIFLHQTKSPHLSHWGLLFWVCLVLIAVLYMCFHVWVLGLIAGFYMCFFCTNTFFCKEVLPAFVKATSLAHV